MQVDKIKDLQRDYAIPSVGSDGVPYRPVWRRKGVLNSDVVKLVAFIIISISLVACAALCLTAVWGGSPTDTIWRALVSLGIVVLTTVLFVIINETFGTTIEFRPKPSAEQEPPTDG